MSSKKLIVVMFLAISLAWLIYESAKTNSSYSTQIDSLEDYPWCSWGGAVKDGKPHGFGTGGCVFGQEPLTKQGLSPPLSEIQRQYLDRADKALSTGKPVERRKCDGSPAVCECISYHELLISARIDDYTTFIGNYSRGKREGEGMFFYSDGTTYHGQWRDDKRHGNGALLSASCEVIYEGQWCADRQGQCPSA